MGGGEILESALGRFAKGKSVGHDAENVKRAMASCAKLVLMFGAAEIRLGTARMLVQMPEERLR